MEINNKYFTKEFFSYLKRLYTSNSKIKAFLR